MRIEILKNKETSLVIDDIGKSIEEDGILQEGYKKAIQAFEQYILQSKQVRNQLKNAGRSDSQINDILYQSSHNIIAFSGRRGTGKTSAMISFSEFLKNRGGADQSKKLWDKSFADIYTLVLSPIDPTMLENDQNILSVVLSRLLFKAEERWNRNPSFYRDSQILENDKNELLRKADACLNGIQAVKEKGNIKSLAELQRIGDSAVLKKNLFDFVDTVNSFCMGKENANPENNYLVIPIDDTDCQIQKAHEVMEDIRRYLTIPNVLILMATDGDMLRHVFAQHYAEEFKTGMDREFLKPVRMEHYAEKYLTKLIPGTHRIYLPVFENVLKGNSVSLELGYYADNSRDKDLISESSRADREKRRLDQDYSGMDFNFQSKVLNFIFHKTGMVFFEHTAYINNIIPTTMRGLAHLLNFLDSMEKVEEINLSREYDPQDFKKALIRRMDIIERNLDLFEEYFMNEWVFAKVPGEMVGILREIEEQVPANLVQYAYDEICAFYKNFNDPHDVNYYELMTLLGGLNGIVESIQVGAIHKHRVDFYNTFAVRTLLSIKNNKQAVRIKKKILETSLMQQDNTTIFEMDYSPYDLIDSFPQSVSKDNSTGDKQSCYERILMPIVDIFRELLLNKNRLEEKQTQNGLYCTQELSWLVLCNWDIQDTIYKSVESYLRQENKTPEGMWNYIGESIAQKNSNMLKDIIDGGLIKISEWPQQYRNILGDFGNKPEVNASDSNTSLYGINQIKGKVQDIITIIEKRKGINLGVIIGDLEDTCGLLYKEIERREDLLKSKENVDETDKSAQKKEISELKEFMDVANSCNSIIKKEYSPDHDSGFDVERDKIPQITSETKEQVQRWALKLMSWIDDSEKR